MIGPQTPPEPRHTRDIACRDAAFRMNKLRRPLEADFSSEEEFLRWKQWSDEDYYETERRGRGYYDNGVPLDEHISAAGAVESAEDAYFRELLADEIEAARKALCQERMAKDVYKRQAPFGSWLRVLVERFFHRPGDG